MIVGLVVGWVIKLLLVVVVLSAIGAVKMHWQKKRATRDFWDLQENEPKNRRADRSKKWGVAVEKGMRSLFEGFYPRRSNADLANGTTTDVDGGDADGAAVTTHNNGNGNGNEYEVGAALVGDSPLPDGAMAAAGAGEMQSPAAAPKPRGVLTPRPADANGVGSHSRRDSQASLPGIDRRRWRDAHARVPSLHLDLNANGGGGGGDDGDGAAFASPEHYSSDVRRMASPDRSSSGGSRHRKRHHKKHRKKHHKHSKRTRRHDHSTSTSTSSADGDERRLATALRVNSGDDVAMLSRDVCLARIRANNLVGTRLVPAEDGAEIERTAFQLLMGVVQDAAGDDDQHVGVVRTLIAAQEAGGLVHGHEADLLRRLLARKVEARLAGVDVLDVPARLVDPIPARVPTPPPVPPTEPEPEPVVIPEDALQAEQHDNKDGDGGEEKEKEEEVAAAALPERVFDESYWSEILSGESAWATLLNHSLVSTGAELSVLHDASVSDAAVEHKAGDQPQGADLERVVRDIVKERARARRAILRVVMRREGVAAGSALEHELTTTVAHVQAELARRTRHHHQPRHDLLHAAASQQQQQHQQHEEAGTGSPRRRLPHKKKRRSNPGLLRAKSANMSISTESPRRRKTPPHQRRTYRPNTPGKLQMATGAATHPPPVNTSDALLADPPSSPEESPSVALRARRAASKAVTPTPELARHRDEHGDEDAGKHDHQRAEENGANVVASLVNQTV